MLQITQGPGQERMLSLPESSPGGAQDSILMTISSLPITVSENEDTPLTVALAEPERDLNTFITSWEAAVQPH